MKTFRAFGVAAALALTGLSGCATNFNADVARFQRLPAPQGQTFAVVSDDPRLAGGLEFANYAELVSQAMAQQGYRPASDPGSADLVVRMAYSVDTGREKIRSTGGWGYDPFYGPGFGWGYGRGWRTRWGYGFNDPFLFGAGGFNDVSSYTVYTGMLDLKIDRAADGVRLFEGKASAQSLSNRLTYLVPNLVNAMFTDFPGRSGEEIRITVAPPEKR